MGAMASCDSDADDAETDPSTGTRPSAETGSGQGTGSNDPLDDLAASASDALDSPPLLRIRNKTSQVVVLRSADGKSTSTVAPGKPETG